MSIHTYWMSLSSAEATLILVKETETNNLFTAHLHGLTRKELVQTVAKGLYREKRFGHQTSSEVSVAEHSLWLGSWLKAMIPEVADYGYLHDTPESVFHDTCKMLKTDETCVMEDAIYEAMDWGVPHPKGDALGAFKFWDSVASAAEGELFGYAWPWLKTYRNRFGSGKIDAYKQHILQYQGNTVDGNIQRMWELAARGILLKRKKLLSHIFRAPKKILNSITHG